MRHRPTPTIGWANVHERGSSSTGHADEQIASIHERAFDRRVREDAGEALVRVGHDALRLVGDHRRHLAALAEPANRRGVRVAPCPETDEEQRPFRARDQVIQTGRCRVRLGRQLWHGVLP
jgi:hypothetical protein